MKKIIDKIRNNRLYFYCLVIGITIIAILYKLNNVTPLGGNSLLCIDFFHQYGPMLAELYDRVRGGADLIYSFNMAMGLPFFRNFLNYLSSPFNIIMFLFNRDNLITSYSFIIGGKAIASLITMVYYLSKKFNTKDIFLIPLGIIYAFSAYFTAYYWNIMWLDGMVLLPLIVLGIENIINNGKWKLYTISLAIMLFANYFIGYMICIFSCVYFLFYLISKTKFSLKEWKATLSYLKVRIIKFTLGSLAAGGLVAVFLIPLFLSLKSISATGGIIPTSQYYAFEFKDFILSHLTGVDKTVFASDTITSPNISCGILAIGLLLLYILNIKIPIKKKICYLAIMAFMIFAFFNAPLDYIFHGFHVPNDLPYRYSFLYSFILVVIATYSLINIKKLNYITVVFSYVLLMASLFYILNLNWAGITNNMLYINMILLTLYFLFYSAIHFIDKFHILIYIIFIIVAMIDVLVANNYNWDITQVLKVFYEDYESTEELLNYAASYDDSLFYRIENTNMLTLNDPSWYNYYGQTTFSSMAYENMAILQHNLGIPGNEINSYYYVQQTPIYDLMFGIKYFIGNTNDYARYKELYSNNETLNEFLYNVGLAYGVNDSIKYWDYTNPNPFIVQNDFISKATGIDDVLKEADIINVEEIYSDDSELIYKYTIKNNKDNYYFYSNDYSVDFFIIGESLYYNNDVYTNYNDIDELYYSYLDDYGEKNIINISSMDENIIIYVAYNAYYSNGFYAYEIDQGKFEEAYNKLMKNRLDISSFKEHKIEGNISVKNNMLVYTSIPYDIGWQVYVDGVKANTYALGDALLAFEAKAGNHKVEIKYEIPYFKRSLAISITTLLLVIFSKYFYILKNKLIKPKDNRISSILNKKLT